MRLFLEWKYIDLTWMAVQISLGWKSMRETAVQRERSKKMSGVWISPWIPFREHTDCH